MSLHNYGVSREDRAEVAVARKGWDDFFKKVETENQYHSASSTPESDIAQSEGKRKPSAFGSHIGQTERKGKRAKRADTPRPTPDEEECASENFDDPTKFCPEKCLFCLRIYSSFDQNLDHMKNMHEFIIPIEGSLSPLSMPPEALIHYIHRLKNNDPPALLEELCDLGKRNPTSELFSHALNRAIARRKRGDFIEEYRLRFQTGSKISHHREAIIDDPVMAKLYFIDEYWI